MAERAATQARRETDARQGLDFGLFEQGCFWGAFREKAHAEEEIERLERMLSHSSRSREYRRWTVRNRSGEAVVTMERNKKKTEPK